MFEKPKSGYTIYTKSGCKYCDKVKNRFPHAYFINCDKYLENKESFLNFIDTLTDAKPRTFPMVFVDSKYKGGYDDTKLQFNMNAEF